MIDSWTDKQKKYLQYVSRFWFLDPLMIYDIFAAYGQCFYNSKLYPEANSADNFAQITQNRLEFCFAFALFGLQLDRHIFLFIPHQHSWHAKSCNDQY